MLKKNRQRNLCIRCGKRTNKSKIICSECEAREYHKQYYRDKIGRKKRITKCLECKSNKNVMPFVGLCKECYLIKRLLSKDESKEK